ncbi:hypothetical protein QGX11_gp086 [Pseudomonas phage PPSC2]|uniref:Uncharacterized protein n=1 Tax=Pseudomonas phage PPSC2 TaxID=2041350 RepID=A0A2R2YB35_9CAUD|nr:hypothetical protein QGX11_gp086 [Pseudomonas phage PPSC2]ATN92849.1 hypothetical protein PPSC2_86 [Pseudomonas phage PPSC2]
MTLPAEFQIKVKDKAEWELAWNILSSLYKVSENSNELRYSKGCIIKVGTISRVLLWTSQLGETLDYKTYESWEEFSVLNQEILSPVKKVTLDVCHRLVAYDCEIVKLQAQLENLREKHQREVDQLEETLNILTSDMNALKSEYDVE